MLDEVPNTITQVDLKKVNTLDIFTLPQQMFSNMCLNLIIPLTVMSSCLIGMIRFVFTGTYLLTLCMILPSLVFMLCIYFTWFAFSNFQLR